MRVFSINQKINGQVRLTDSINCQLSCSDLLVIKTCLEKAKKFENEVLESSRFNIVETLKSLENG